MIAITPAIQDIARRVTEFGNRIPESVQSERVVLLRLLRPASRGDHAGRAMDPRLASLNNPFCR
jgi:hypothetical protein